MKRSNRQKDRRYSEGSISGNLSKTFSLSGDFGIIIPESLTGKYNESYVFTGLYNLVMSVSNNFFWSISK